MKMRTIKLLNGLGVALLAVVGLYIIFSRSANRSIETANDILEADGRPMKLEDLMPVAIPDADNAALVYAAAVLQLEAEEVGEMDLLSQLTRAASKVVLKSPDADALEEFRRLYQSPAVAEALAAVEEGSLKPGYRRDLDLRQGAALELPHAGELVSLSRILAATARLQTADGDHAAAWRTALTGLRLANALEEEPLLISQVIRAATLHMAVETVQQLDFTTEPLHFQLGEVDRLLKRFEDPAPMAAGVDAERVWGGEVMYSQPSAAFDLMKHTFDDDPGAGIMAGLYAILPPLRDRDRAAHMSLMGAHARNLLEPYSPETDPGFGEQLMDDIPAHYILTRTFAPGLGHLKMRMVTMFAEARVTRAGLAVLEHRDRTGAYPADLQSLGVGDVADPFTGGPLVYKPGPTGFTLYSLGEDGADDQGAPLEKCKGDIVWNYSEQPSTRSGD